MPSPGRPQAAVTFTGRVIYACPDCEGDLEEDAFELWCPGCQSAVSLADMHVDRESDPWF